MELCTTPRAISIFPNHHTRLTTKPTHFRSKSSIPFRQTLLSPTIVGLRSRSLYVRNTFSRASSSEETSGGANRYGVEERESVITLENVTSAEKEILNENGATEVPKEDSPTEDQTQSFEFLDQLNIKFDSDDTYSLLLYGGGALVALWLSAAIVGAIDSIPLFPKLMEIVGLGYTFWFSYRFLIFKKNREELAAKIEELKQQVLGLDDE